MWVGGQRHTLTALLLGKRPSTHCTGGCVGPRAGLVIFGKSCPIVIWSPDYPTFSKFFFGCDDFIVFILIGI